MARMWRVEALADTTYLVVAAPAVKGSLPKIFSTAVDKFGVSITGMPETVEDSEFGQAFRYPAEVVPGFPTHPPRPSRSPRQ
jgi:hypothetical protein